MARVLIISAPSGCGKSTLVEHLRHEGLDFYFSISCASRKPRPNEKHGVDYYFISPEEFRERIAHNEFLEYEEVYTDRYYGTLRSEVDDRLNEGIHVVCDVDVNGALRIKQHYGERALAIFIAPPSVDALRQRLIHRNTETMEEIEKRVARAEYEISQSPKFDRVLVNDDLDTAKAEFYSLVKSFLD